MTEPQISFSPLQRADFALLARWLQEPLVARWWDHEWTPEALERDFGPSVDRTDPTEIYLASQGGSPFGLIQRYRLDSYRPHLKALAAIVPVPPAALSIDYLIGDPALRGRGMGAAMIRAFVSSSWAAYPEAPAVIVPVVAANIASWRALERAGMHRAGAGELEPDNPVDSREHVVYRVDRPPLI